MALEFEKLTADIELMAQGAHRQREERQRRVELALQKLREYATDWEKIDDCLSQALAKVDIKKYRASKPLNTSEPLDGAFDPPSLPPKATLVASDGSQILPDRHAAYLYSLINVGVVIYFHGDGLAPVQITRPALNYPGKYENSPDQFVDRGTLVSMRRDQAEIETLAQECWTHRDKSPPILAILDQRMLYWPAVGTSDEEGRRVLQAWQNAMSEMRHCGALLAGYVVRPGKQSVLTMLDTLDIEESWFDPGVLEVRDDTLGLTDANLFRLLLEPGQRSAVFVDVSQHNEDFRKGDPANEVCFFYINPARAGRQIARVDIPMWVASEPSIVGVVQALIYDQCQIIGDYPYVLARADEIAVVGRHDQESLNTMIDNTMLRHGMMRAVTAKQGAKGAARAGKTRHEL